MHRRARPGPAAGAGTARRPAILDADLGADNRPAATNSLGPPPQTPGGAGGFAACYCGAGAHALRSGHPVAASMPSDWRMGSTDISVRPNVHSPGALRVIEPPGLRIPAIWCAALGLLAAGDARADEAPATPAAEEFVVIPLRVHVLTSKDLPEVDCRLTDGDVARILGKVNGVWHRAGIHWGLESLVREPAEREEAFAEARGRDGRGNLGNYRLLFPEGSREFDGLHVYYLHRLPVNGVWLGGGAAVVQETAGLREVEGGIDEPIPRVTAHELGHALGLPHRQARTNLLASGTTGTALNAEEVESARRAARSIAGALPVPDARKAADAADARGDREAARRLRGWLAQLPGAGR